jgi:hypothetical protein
MIKATVTLIALSVYFTFKTSLLLIEEYVLKSSSNIAA